MSGYLETIRCATRNRAYRGYPGRQDRRYDGSIIFPHVEPKFTLDLDSRTTVFTIGSCFARNIEEALEPLGVRLPTRAFSVPRSEWANRPNGMLNEYNPGTMNQRIMAALRGARPPEETIVPSGSLFADLLLPGGADVPYDRALQRREEIFQVYQALSDCDLVVITLGFIEAWFDQETKTYLNRVPPHSFAAANPDRFTFRRLGVGDSTALLEEAMQALSNSGKKVVLTVSPVPISLTFESSDCVVANEYSKAVLRVCAENLSRTFPNVDYFPSYEIVRTAGLSGYIEDNVHVRNELVGMITRSMVRIYQGQRAEEQTVPS